MRLKSITMRHPWRILAILVMLLGSFAMMIEPAGATTSEGPSHFYLSANLSQLGETAWTFDVFITVPSAHPYVSYGSGSSQEYISVQDKDDIDYNINLGWIYQPGPCDPNTGCGVPNGAQYAQVFWYDTGPNGPDMQCLSTVIIPFNGTVQQYEFVINYPGPPGEYPWTFVCFNVGDQCNQNQWTARFDTGWSRAGFGTVSDNAFTSVTNGNPATQPAIWMGDKAEPNAVSIGDDAAQRFNIAGPSQEVNNWTSWTDNSVPDRAPYTSDVQSCPRASGQACPYDSTPVYAYPESRAEFDNWTIYPYNG